MADGCSLIEYFIYLLTYYIIDLIHHADMLLAKIVIIGRITSLLASCDGLSL